MGWINSETINQHISSIIHEKFSEYEDKQSIELKTFLIAMNKSTNYCDFNIKHLNTKNSLNKRKLLFLVKLILIYYGRIYDSSIELEENRFTIKNDKKEFYLTS